MKTQLSPTDKMRQTRLSVLAKSTLSDIKHFWKDTLKSYPYETIRQPQIGMVMAVARAGASGEPFNLGEVSVTRCAIRLEGGETGIGYVTGNSKDHALHIAVLDALAQTPEQQEPIDQDVIKPLHEKLLSTNKQQQDKAVKTKVDFFTMVRGED